MAIKIALPSQSMSFIHFVQKAITDNDFFSRVAEAPAAAMIQYGVRLDTAKLKAKDVRTLIDTIIKVKEAIANKHLRDKVVFEAVFGRTSPIPDKSIVMEQSPSTKTSEGSCTKWDSSNESSAKKSESCSKSYTEFQKNAGGTSLKIDDVMNGPLVSLAELTKMTESLTKTATKIAKAEI